MDIDELVEKFQRASTGMLDSAVSFQDYAKAADALLALHRHCEAMDNDLKLWVIHGEAVGAETGPTIAILNDYRAEFPRKP